MTSQGVKSALTSQILSGLEGGYEELLSNLTQEQKTQLVGTIVSASLEGAASGVSEEDILEGISEPVASGLKATARAIRRFWRAGSHTASEHGHLGIIRGYVTPQIVGVAVVKWCE